MNNVIDLASVRAARRAAVCTFEIFGAERRPSATDIVSVGIVCDLEIGAELIKTMPARSVLEFEGDGRFWLEGYLTFAEALALEGQCLARGFGRVAG